MTSATVLKYMDDTMLFEDTAVVTSIEERDDKVIVLLDQTVFYPQGGGQPWDNHDELEKNHRKLAGECSQGIGALIADLKDRGLFEDTLIVIGGEFGRTPTVENHQRRQIQTGS